MELSIFKKIRKIEDIVKTLAGKHKKICGFIGIVIILTVCVIGANAWVNRYTPYFPKESAKIFLFGEKHGEDKCFSVELKEWQKFYAKGNRDLFIEMPYYSAQYLNQWMRSNDDKLLLELYDELEGTRIHVSGLIEFYRNIKVTCPDTVFHGTDLGHQYYSTGARYLKYAVDVFGENSEEVQRTKDCIRQGERYYSMDGAKSDKYRENVMTDNFQKEYDRLSDSVDGFDNLFVIMGIYGNAHCDPRSKSVQVDCMAKQLQGKYGDIIQYEYVMEMKE